MEEVRCTGKGDNSNGKGGVFKGLSRPVDTIEMTMVLTHLGTGSRGNATLLETEQAKVLIDQGFSGAQLEKRLARLNIHPTEIDYIFVSHHHLSLIHI